MIMHKTLFFPFQCLFLTLIISSTAVADAFDDWVNQRNRQQLYNALNAIERLRTERKPSYSQEDYCSYNTEIERWLFNNDIEIKYKLSCDGEFKVKYSNESPPVH